MRHVGEAEAAIAIGFDRRAARQMRARRLPPAIVTPCVVRVRRLPTSRRRPVPTPR